MLDYQELSEEMEELFAATKELARFNSQKVWDYYSEVIKISDGDAWGLLPIAEKDLF